jgi:hypothetical protein
MKHSLLALSVAALLTQVPAQAVTQNLGALAINVPAPFAVFNPPGAFLDLFQFTVPSPSLFGVAAANFGAFAALDTKLVSTSLVSDPDGVPGNFDDVVLVTNGAIGNVLLLAAPVVTGNYYLTVAGQAIGIGGGAYHGNALLAPIPEPETYALMLAGVGVVAFLLRRRNGQIECSGTQFDPI